MTEARQVAYVFNVQHKREPHVSQGYSHISPLDRGGSKWPAPSPQNKHRHWQNTGPCLHPSSSLCPGSRGQCPLWSSGQRRCLRGEATADCYRFIQIGNSHTVSFYIRMGAGDSQITSAGSNIQKKQDHNWEFRWSRWRVNSFMKEWDGRHWTLNL